MLTMGESPKNWSSTYRTTRDCSHLTFRCLNQYFSTVIKSNQIKWGVCSELHTEEQRPAAHYDNKIQENKIKSNLKFAIKRTTTQIGLQLSFESSSGNSLSYSEAGRLFQTPGPAMEKARSPNLVRVRCTAAAPFVVDLRHRVDEKLMESQR